MLTILHASDLQCGRPYRPWAADALVRLAADVGPDVIVLSGDLTQRAKPSEYRTAAGIIDRLPEVPVVVTPGNHDVPLFRVWERALAPYWNWRRFISPRLDSVTHVPGATFVSINSSAPRRALVNGRVDPVQLDFARHAFDGSPAGDDRIMVVHHHFVATEVEHDGAPLPGAERVLRAFEDMGVDLVLGGHVHHLNVTTSRALLAGAGPGIPLIASGTTTSRRGRGAETERNSLNVVKVTDHEIEVVPHFLEAEGGAFQPAAPVVLERPGVRTGEREAGAGEARP